MNEYYKYTIKHISLIGIERKGDIIMYLTIDGIEKSFPHKEKGQVKVLDNIHLDVEKGQFVSIVGPSGCGKSTLLYLIAGLEKADKGEIRIAGKIVTRSRTGSCRCFPRRWIISMVNSS